MNLDDMLPQSDGLSVAVALLLLLMSVVSWFIIVYKVWLLHLAVRHFAV
jgi:biopolymer transport protein ExbB/TolQ